MSSKVADESGRMLIGAVLVLTVAYALLADVSGSHLLNPEWHPHARFHLAQMLAMLTADFGLGLWLLLRRSHDPMAGVTAAAILGLAFWTPILWVSTVVPGADLYAGAGVPVPLIFGIKVYLNVIAAVLAVGLIAFGWWRARAAHNGPPQNDRT